MPRLRPVKTNFTNGEVDPLITMRSDLELFVNGAAKMRNVRPFPQGGFRRDDGLEHMTQIPPGGQSIPIGIVEAKIALPAGTGYLVGDKLTVVGGTGTAARVEVEATIFSSGIITALIQVDGGDYTVLPSSGTTLAGGTGTGATVTFDATTQNVLQEVDFTFAVDQNYLIVFTAVRGYIFRREDSGSGANQLVFTFLHPYDNLELPAITWTQSLDVMLVFHKDQAIMQLTRKGESDWTWEVFKIINPPSFAFGEVQTAKLSIPAAENVGDIITITATSLTPFTDGEENDFIRVFGTANIDGADRSSYFKMVDVLSSTTVSVEVLVLPLVTATYIVNGVEWLQEEPEWSFARGYPRCGTFFQGRLCIGGSRGRPNTFWASRTGDINDFNNGGAADDLGISITADSGDISTFLNIYPGRHLQIFADSSEFYIPISEAEPITPTTASLRRTSSVGSRGGIPVFEVDGVVYFVQRGGESFRQFLFVDNEKAYSADIVSLFSSHLIRSPIDAAFKKSLNTEDGNYIFLVNGQDGSLAEFSILRSELINAWSLRTTKGSFEGVAVLDQGSYFHMKRFPGGLVTFTDRFFSVEPETQEPHGLVYNGDGSKFFVCSDSAGAVGVFEYDLAEPFTLAGGGASYSGNFFDTSGENANPRAIQFNADGLKMFVLSSNNVDEYDLTVPYSIAAGNVSFSGNSFDASGDDNQTEGLHFSPDGFKMFISGEEFATIFEYTLTSAFSMVGGNVSLTASFDVSSEAGDPEDVTFNNDGTRMYVADDFTLKIYQYFLENPFSLATGVTFSGAFVDVKPQEPIAPLSMAFSADGSILLVNGSSDERIFEYAFDQPFKIGVETDTIEFFNPGLKFDAGVIETSISSPVDSATGLDFLANAEVELIIDGTFAGTFVVTDAGVLTFPFTALKSYQFGIPFPQIEGEEDGVTVLVQTLPSDVLLAEGSTMGNKKRVSEANVRVVDTQGFYLQNVQVPFRPLPFVLGTAITPQSGDFEVKGLLGWDDFGQIKITQKEPLDMTVLGLAYNLNTK